MVGIFFIIINFGVKTALGEDNYCASASYYDGMPSGPPRIICTRLDTENLVSCQDPKAAVNRAHETTENQSILLLQILLSQDLFR